MCCCRDRVIHLLAVRAYKEPELILRLQRGAVFRCVFDSCLHLYHLGFVHGDLYYLSVKV